MQVCAFSSKVNPNKVNNNPKFNILFFIIFLFYCYKERLACCRTAARWVCGLALGGIDSKPLFDELFYYNLLGHSLSIC